MYPRDDLWISIKYRVLPAQVKIRESIPSGMQKEIGALVQT